MKVLSSVKRPASSILTTKSATVPSKRSQTIDAQSTVTHTGSPVNPFTAKALASKLNERNNSNTSSNNSPNHVKQLANANAKVFIKEIPVPPLISIQMPQQRTFETENTQQHMGMILNDKPKLTPINKKVADDLDSDLNVPTFNIFKKSTSCLPINGIEDSIKPHQNTVTSEEPKMVNLKYFLYSLY